MSATHRWVLVASLLGSGAAVVHCTASTPGGGSDDGGLAPDTSVPVDGPVPVEDASTEDASTEDASTEDASTEDASADAGIDATDASTDAADAGGPPYVLVSCRLGMGPSYAAITSWIDSNGNRYGVNNMLPPTAGGPVPPFPAPYGMLPEGDLATLKTATQMLHASSAGFTTTTGPKRHNITWIGELYSAGASGQPPTLVDRYTDGASYGKSTITSHNDPIADVIRKYRCFNLE